MIPRQPWSFMPQDAEQALIIKRFMMAVGSYLMWVVLVCICVIQGFTRFSYREVLVFSLAVILINAGFYAVIRSGLNKRFKDPSLTMAQMVLATFCIMVCLYNAGEIRSSMLLLYFVVFVFGVFRLRVRQFLVLSLFALSNYALVAYLLYRFHPQEIDVRLELINLLFLATVLPWFSLVGGYITKLRSTLARALDTIETLAVTDELTQVYNRRRLLEILKDQKSKCDRGSKPFSIGIFDLDHFKKVNDSFGHETGDIVLKSLAGAIRRNIRDIDCIARYGGEEFVLVLGSTDKAEAILLAERIREMVEMLRYEGLGDLSVTISMGLAVYLPQEDFQQTLNRADTALYRAKANGRNRVEFEPKAESRQLYLF